MLSGFVSLFPDELLSSAVARYGNRFRFPTMPRLLDEVFDGSRSSYSIDFPTRLLHLTTQLPPGYLMTIDQLIDAHTFHPYHAPFLPEERAARLRREIQVGGGHCLGRRLITGRRTSVSVQEMLRYCPSCVQEDRVRFDECYWHRLHQIPGIEVCPLHGVWLESSGIPAWNSSDRQRINTAEQVLGRQNPRFLSAYEPGRESLLALARNAAWLLTHPQPSAVASSYPERYRFLLAERGWGTYRKRLPWTVFWKAFLQVHPLAMLRRLDGHAGRLRSGRGIRALLHMRGQAMPPLYHLLMIHFLGFTAEEFFALPQQPIWFGSGPWPCLNPAAPHRNERAVVHCDMRIRRQDGRPIGTFSCGCGFTYSRVGPDWGPLAQFSCHSVEQYGLYWEWVLRRRWRDRRLTREALAEQLGVSRVTLWEQAIRLGLISKTNSLRAGTRWNRVVAVQPNDREQKRVQWQQLAQRRRRTLAQERRRQRLYAWLFRWDGAWLQTHQGGLREIGGNRDWAPRLDWAARDRQVAGAITRTAAKLNALQGPPQWISRHRLITHSGYARWIAPYLDRLPQTRQVIQTAVETRQAFQLRRAAWYEGREKEVAGMAAESWSRHPPVPSACGQQGLFDASEGGW